MKYTSGTSKSALNLFFRRVKQNLSSLNLDVVSGVLLFITAILALVFSNSEPLKAFYSSLLNYPITFSIGDYTFNKSLKLLVNDGLMAIFFYYVGLEIKKEFIIGDLSNIKKATFSIFSALGGMIVPALIFVSFNLGQETISGWGIPMATDIAFALGLIALLGSKIPKSLKTFLLALAIVDDLGAILVIALFYTNTINTLALILALVGLVVIFFLNKTNSNSFIVSLLLGLIIWFAFLKSGVHATIAGVLLALLKPLKQSDTAFSEGLVSNFDELIHKLHPWMLFVVLPVFAFFNAGVDFGSVQLKALMEEPVTIGIILGLFVGKPVGVMVFSIFSVKLGLSRKPENFSWLDVFGVSLLSAIGFTMSLFIASLAFSNDLYFSYSKIAIYIASVLAMIFGYVVLYLSWQNKERALR